MEVNKLKTTIFNKQSMVTHKKQYMVYTSWLITKNKAYLSLFTLILY